MMYQLSKFRGAGVSNHRKATGAPQSRKLALTFASIALMTISTGSNAQTSDLASGFAPGVFCHRHTGAGYEPTATAWGLVGVNDSGVVVYGSCPNGYGLRFPAGMNPGDNTEMLLVRVLNELMIARTKNAQLKKELETWKKETLEMAVNKMSSTPQILAESKAVIDAVAAKVSSELAENKEFRAKLKRD